MARLAANNYYLSWDGVDISPHTIEGGLDDSVEEIDTTAGAGKEHTETAPGLRTITFKANVAYDDASVSTYIQKMKAGETGTLIYGPESNVSGKPKHEQSMMVVSVSGPKQDVKKKFVMFELSLKGIAAPTTDIYAGGTFA